jgi:hypothetical protein
LRTEMATHHGVGEKPRPPLWAGRVSLKLGGNQRRRKRLPKSSVPEAGAHAGAPHSVFRLRGGKNREIVTSSGTTADDCKTANDSGPTTNWDYFFELASPRGVIETTRYSRSLSSKSSIRSSILSFSRRNCAFSPTGSSTGCLSSLGRTR